MALNPGHEMAIAAILARGTPANCQDAAKYMVTSDVQRAKKVRDVLASMVREIDAALIVAGA